MGIFSSLFKAKDKNSSADPVGKQDQRAESAPSPLGNFHLSGASERTVYIYNEVPLAGIGNGQEFVLDVIAGKVSLTSTLTGTAYSSDDGGIPLGYNGVPVGFMGSAEREIKALLKKGHSVSVLAKCTGMYDKDFPNVVALLPPNKEIKSLADPDQKARDEGLIVSYNVYERNDALEKLVKSKKQVLVEIKTLPTKKGSSAKPRITLVDGSAVFDEFGARNSHYAAFAEHVGRTVKISATKRSGSLDGGDYYHIEADLR